MIAEDELSELHHGHQMSHAVAWEEEYRLLRFFHLFVCSFVFHRRRRVYNITNENEGSRLST